MAYVIPWNNATPAGSELASTADDYFRNTKFAIYERLTGLLVVDWTDDPLVLVPEVSGLVTSRELCMAVIWKSYDNNISIDPQENRTDAIKSVSGTEDFGCIFTIPIGYVLDEVTVYVDRNGETLTLNVVQIPMTTGIEAVIDSAALAGAGIQATTITGLATTIASATNYGLRFAWSSASGTVSVYGVLIKISKVDNTQGY